LNAYAGAVLRVNLTDRTLHREALDPAAARLYLGGRGLNVYRLYHEVPPHTDGLSPDNKLLFGVGTLVGTLFPGGARFNVTHVPPDGDLG